MITVTTMAVHENFDRRYDLFDADRVYGIIF